MCTMTGTSPSSFTMDVLVSNQTDIDWELFEMWLDGQVEGICVNQLRERYKDENLNYEDILSELQNNFRLFGMLEPLLHQPNMFSEQLVWQLDHSIQRQLIGRYYALDDSVARELLGRKLSGRLRKDLDEVSEKTGVPLKSCRRQFDNIKRIFKAVEEAPGRFTTNIKNLFNLSSELATKYCVLIFIAVHRFETTKKKLSNITFSDLSIVTQSIMANWTPGFDVDEGGDPVLDRDYLGTLREIKNIQDREKDHRNLFIQTVSKYGDERLIAEAESHFKSLNRNILALASSLFHSKELKEIFISVLERIVEPLALARFSTKQVNIMLKSYEEIVVENLLHLEPMLKVHFIKFFSTLKTIIETFFVRL
eukprot:TRINITY_DN2952_c0_g1_i1.p1 TRINITY_DN2952_c0_g1~~TRINITY_DN2952_c0_g1_i1.p1  ORF type:complete len:366 (+),score=57.01 TRINITY_DN2952_c0_g1_i1:37-1134(+)